jgi:hypothetical protein
MNRYSYSKSISRLIDRSERYYATLPAFRIVHNPEAVLAAKTELEAISKRLDSSEPVNTKGLSSLKELLSDGVASPLFKSDPQAAKQAVASIREELATV